MGYRELMDETRKEARKDGESKGYIRGLEWARDSLELLPSAGRLIEIEIGEGNETRKKPTKETYEYLGELNTELEKRILKNTVGGNKSAAHALMRFRDFLTNKILEEESG